MVGSVVGLIGRSGGGGVLPGMLGPGRRWVGLDMLLEDPAAKLAQTEILGLSLARQILFYRQVHLDGDEFFFFHVSDFFRRSLMKINLSIKYLRKN